jgi:hypothetical protein
LGVSRRERDSGDQREGGRESQDPARCARGQESFSLRMSFNCSPIGARVSGWYDDSGRKDAFHCVSRRVRVPPDFKRSLGQPGWWIRDATRGPHEGLSHSKAAR